LSLIARIGKRRFLAGITTPILLGSAGREQVVATASHYRAARLLPDCTLFELPESKHEPFLERDPIRNAWLDEINRFLGERLNMASADYSTLRNGVQ